MARKKNVQQDSKIITPDIPLNGDLLLRVKKISKQTGLSHQDLIQKWVLQEELQIGLILHGKGQFTAEAKVSPKAVRQQTPVAKKKGAPKASASQKKDKYRKKLVQKVKKLKNDGMTLKKIAEAFNDKKVPTVSGAGKWYTSSISWLLKPIKAN